MTNLDRILITIWISLISAGLVVLSQSRPKKVEHQTTVFHIQTAYMEVRGEGFIMSGDTVFETKREVEK